MYGHTGSQNHFLPKFEVRLRTPGTTTVQWPKSFLSQCGWRRKRRADKNWTKLRGSWKGRQMIYMSRLQSSRHKLLTWRHNWQRRRKSCRLLWPGTHSWVCTWWKAQAGTHLAPFQTLRSCSHESHLSVHPLRVLPHLPNVLLWKIIMLLLVHKQIIYFIKLPLGINENSCSYRQGQCCQVRWNITTYFIGNRQKLIKSLTLIHRISVDFLYKFKRENTQPKHAESTNQHLQTLHSDKVQLSDLFCISSPFLWHFLAQNL